MIRQCLTKRISFDERTMACLFAADRIDHLTNETSGILKSVNNGTTVICDRYVLSSFAYQSAGAPLDWVMDLNDQAGDIIRPDLHIYMDIPVEMSLERIDRNRASHELYETRDRLNKVKSNYEHIIEKLTGLGQESIFTVDATLSPDAIADKIWYRVTGLLNNG
jgi:dTMP kinase